MIQCYRNIDEGEFKDEIVDDNHNKILVAQIDLVLNIDSSPIQVEGVTTYPLNPNEVPLLMTVEPAEWKALATSIAKNSNQLIYHQSRNLTFLYFGGLLFFIVLLTAIKVFVESSLVEAILLGSCLVGILVFVVIFNRLPVWHDSSLDNNILDIVASQPLSGYILTYYRMIQSEGLFGTVRRIRVYRQTSSYSQPNLKE
jgi:hypothetical protein